MRTAWCMKCRKDAVAVGTYSSPCGGIRMQVACHGDVEQRTASPKTLAKGNGLEALEDLFKGSVFLFLKNAPARKYRPIPPSNRLPGPKKEWKKPIYFWDHLLTPVLRRYKLTPRAAIERGNLQ